MSDSIENLESVSESTVTPENWDSWISELLGVDNTVQNGAESSGTLAARIMMEEAYMVPLPPDEDDENYAHATTPIADEGSQKAAEEGVQQEEEEFVGRAVICWHAAEGFYAQPLKHPTEAFVQDQPKKPIRLGDWIRYKRRQENGQVVITDYEAIPEVFPTTTTNNSVMVQCKVSVPGDFFYGNPSIRVYLLSDISRSVLDPNKRIKLVHCGEKITATLKFHYEPGADYGYWQIEQIQ